MENNTDGGCLVCSGAEREEISSQRLRRFWTRTDTLYLFLAGGILALALILDFVVPDYDLTLFSVIGLAVSLSAFFYTATLLISGWPVFKNAIKGLRRFSLQVDVLVASAALGALILGHYVESVILIFLYSIAEQLEDYSMMRAEKSLEELFEVNPEQVVVLRNGQEKAVRPEEVEVGELFLLRPGDRVGLDGEVVEGSGAVNEAALTGESRPVYKEKESEIYSGTLNVSGFLKVKALRPSEDSALARIIEMVKDAEQQQAPSQRFMNEFAGYYTPSVIGLALFIAVVFPLLPFVPGGFSIWFFRALVLLVISCPCCLLISTPIAVVSGVTSAARHGVLIKGGGPLETLGRSDVICFDKTGTLTSGEFAVDDIIASGKLSETELLRVAAGLEQGSRHPIALAIMKRARAIENIPEVEEFSDLAGQGVEGRIEDRRYLIGKPEIFNDKVPAEFSDYENKGMTLVCVGEKDEIIGFIALADQVRPEALLALQSIKKLGPELMMLTGDYKTTAAAVADQLEIDSYRAGLLPDDKLEAIRSLKEADKTVAMIGDGVNDAPALALADVGIAMGAIGTDAALETADVALMGDDLRLVAYSIKLSRRARSVIRQNVWSSILVKLSLAAGVIPGAVTLIIAVLVGDMGVALAITYNSLRLGHLQPEIKSDN